MKALNKKEIGSRFRRFMELSGQKQDRLARFLNISQQTVSNIQTGKYLPTTRILTVLASEFGVNLNWLLFRLGDMFKDNYMEKEARFRENYPELSALMEIPDVATVIFSKLIESKKIFSHEIESSRTVDPGAVS